MERTIIQGTCAKPNMVVVPTYIEQNLKAFMPTGVEEPK